MVLKAKRYVLYKKKYHTSYLKWNTLIDIKIGHETHLSKRLAIYFFWPYINLYQSSSSRFGTSLSVIMWRSNVTLHKNIHNQFFFPIILTLLRSSIQSMYVDFHKWLFWRYDNSQKWTQWSLVNTVKIICANTSIWDD